MPNHITNELTCENKETLDSLAGGENRQFIDFETVVPMPEILKGDVDEAVKQWADVALGVVNLSTLRQMHSNPSDSFLAGDYGAAANALRQSNIIRMMNDGPFPKDFESDRFEKFINCLRCIKGHGHASWYEWAVEYWGTKWNAYQQERKSDVIVRFDTAWSAPIKFLEALSKKHPNETFRLRWADEDFGSNTGDITVRGGEVVCGGRFKDDTTESHALALELVCNGEVGEEYKWEDGKRIYVGE